MKLVTALLFLSSILLAAAPAVAQIPSLISYQGRVASAAGVNFDGSGKFKFALVNAAGTTTYWSNDGTSAAGSEPTAAVTLQVSKGLYNLLLGDASLTNMTAIPAAAFANADVRLRVWFDDGVNGSQQLTPDQRLAPAGYLADGAVTAAKVANGAITTQHLDSNITLSGVTTGTFVGNVTGNATNFTGNLAGDVTGTQDATSIAASVVTGKAITGYVSGAGTVTAADSILTAINKLNGNDGLRAPLAGPTFTGVLATTGTISLPTTSGSGSGVIIQSGNRLLHSYGTGNFFLGNNAGNFSLSGSFNTALGSSGLLSLTTGSNNVAVGVSALQMTTTGNGNVAVGKDALTANSSGNVNSAVGSRSLLVNTTGSNNTAVGYESLRSNVSGGNNTAVGLESLFANVAGISNTAVGSQALRSNTANQNSAFGYSALYANTSGAGNVAAGTQALTANTTGDYNVALGVAALLNNTSGAKNTAVGGSALASSTTAGNNTAVGYGALYATTTGYVNCAVGYNALGSNTTGYFNTVAGGEALYLNTIGHSNTANGYQALYSNQSGNWNTACGSQALSANTTASGNTAVGNMALAASTGGDNSALGHLALGANTTGIRNTAVGSVALSTNTTGGSNTAFGVNSALNNTTGASNVAIGVSALRDNTTGSSNIAVGTNAGINLTIGSNNIAIGNAGVAAEDNAIRLGTPGVQTRTFIAGIRGITTGSATGINVLIDNNGQLGTVSSSRRYKEDIADMGSASERLAQLRPVTFRYKKPYDNGGKPVQFGLIAEEVAEVFPELAVYNDEGQPETVKYHDLIPMLLNEWQKQTSRAQAVETALREENAALRKRLAQLETENQARDNGAEMLAERLARLERLVSDPGRPQADAKVRLTNQASKIR